MVPPEAAWQAGAFTRRQALAAGIPRSTVSSRLTRGLWVQLLPQVYAVAGAHGLMTRLHAANLWMPRGTVSHVAAAWLWGLVDEPDVVHLSVPTGCTRRSHRDWLLPVRRDIAADQRFELRGLMVVPPERAVLDCAAVLDRTAAGRLFDRAVRDRISFRELRVQYWADLGCHGSGRAFRQVVSVVPGALSEPERVLARAVRRAGLHGFRVNKPVCGFVADLLDAELGLIVEVDGYRDHSDRDAFHRDRVRQNALVAAGYTVLRFTATQVMQDPRAVVTEIAAMVHQLTSRRRYGNPDHRRSNARSPELSTGVA
jgi:very-short-patch-repair endonuclease